jgi:hypothetical protein
MQTTERSFKTLGILWILFGILCALTAAWLVIDAPVLRLMWGALLTRVPDPFGWMSLFNILLLSAIALAMATTAFSVVGAIALMQRGGPTQVWPIVASILAVMCGPIGIALGVCTLVLLLPRTPGPAYARVPAAA